MPEMTEDNNPKGNRVIITQVATLEAEVKGRDEAVAVINLVDQNGVESHLVLSVIDDLTEIQAVVNCIKHSSECTAQLQLK